MTRWSLVPERLRDNPHFKRRLRVIDGVSIATALVAAGFAVTLSWSLGDNAWMATIYVVFPLIVFVLVAGLFAWLVRLHVVGRLPTDASQLIPLRVRHLARTWWMMRVGLFGATSLLLFAFLLAMVVGLNGGLLFWATMYVVFMSMLGTGVVGGVTNAWIAIHRKRASDADSVVGTDI